MSRNQASYLTRCYRFCRLFVHVVYAVLLVAFFYPHFSKRSNRVVLIPRNSGIASSSNRLERFDILAMTLSDPAIASSFHFAPGKMDLRCAPAPQ